MQSSLDLTLLLIVMSAIASATITFIISRRSVGRQATDIANLTAEVASFRQSSGQSVAELRAKDDTISDLRREASETSDQLRDLRTEHSDMRVALAESNANLASEREQAQQKIALINEAKDQLSNQFKALASEIFEDKSKRFTEQNQVNLDQLLSPLKQQLTDFKTKVEEVYVNEGKDRSALGEQVRQLIALNNTLSEDAQNLTSALKGDRKAQGNWGELILDDVLEKAGLIAGHHYRRQDAIKDEEGTTHVIPDVIIDLPGDRHLVVDSKLTLPDYRAFAAASSDEDRGQALKRHVISIRNHMKGLSDKNYQSLYGLSSLDFVVMFVPLEPAFMLAVTNDAELFQNAWEKNVLLVSPSTLLFVVRTVANLWRQEGLSRNAQTISARGAELYDKLAGFVADLEKVGVRIQQAQDSYGDAKRKLSSGKGNVLRQAEMLRDLGVKPSKSLPEHLLDEPDDEQMAPIVVGARPKLIR
ncbi:MAG: DNA recombination protein RmuC [Rhodanobacter sp.]|jgi:DNA recombination protein RmuC